MLKVRLPINSLGLHARGYLVRDQQVASRHEQRRISVQPVSTTLSRSHVALIRSARRGLVSRSLPAATTGVESKAKEENGGSRDGQRPLGERWGWRFYAVCTTLTAIGAYAVQQLLDTRPRSLNPESFSSYRIVAREAVSPTSFILTAQPVPPPRGILRAALSHLPWSAAAADHGPGDSLSLSPEDQTTLRRAWAHGLWSIEIKQPELQVARAYTPLPPPLPSPGDNRTDDKLEEEAQRTGTLRFLVRPVAGGEVSAYLARLRVGDALEVRGPHLGFDLRARLGSAEARRRVVFLAGGTGIAPALQAARVVLRRGGEAEESKLPPEPRVTIVWANRRRTDCEGCIQQFLPSDLKASRSSGLDLTAAANPIVRQLRELSGRYPGQLAFRCTVDEEKSFIDEKILSQQAGLGQLSGSKSRTTTKPSNPDATAACLFHSTDVTARSPDHDPEDGHCDCGADETAAGKNLLMVSGPEGFVEAYAGPKRWEGGKQLQGPVQGLLGRLLSSNTDVRKDWIVLKL